MYNKAILIFHECKFTNEAQAIQSKSAIYYCQGEALVYSKNYKQALSSFNSCYLIYKKLDLIVKNSENEVRLYENFSTLYKILGNKREADFYSSLYMLGSKIIDDQSRAPKKVSNESLRTSHVNRFSLGVNFQLDNIDRIKQEFIYLKIFEEYNKYVRIKSESSSVSSKMLIKISTKLINENDLRKYVIRERLLGKAEISTDAKSLTFETSIANIKRLQSNHNLSSYLGLS